MKSNTAYTFEKIYADESNSIFRFCLVRIWKRDEALDITQEVFVRLWKSLKAEKRIENMRGFLFTVARRLIIDWYRKKKSFSLDKLTEENVQFPASEIEGEEPYLIVPEGRFLMNKMSELKPASREALYLRYVEGFQPTEISYILKISPIAVSGRINRGISELRKRVGLASSS